jgi:hypothetical protein
MSAGHITTDEGAALTPRDPFRRRAPAERIEPLWNPIRRVGTEGPQPHPAHNRQSFAPAVRGATHIRRAP